MIQQTVTVQAVLHDALKLIQKRTNITSNLSPNLMTSRLTSHLLIHYACQGVILNKTQKGSARASRREGER